MNGFAKWTLAGLLFLATLLNYLDRQTVSVSASVIADEFHLNDADLGRLFFAFFMAYGVAQIILSGVLDRLPVKLAYAGAVTAWSTAGAAGALADGFASLFALRLLLGVCESPNWPLALRATARAFPPKQRPLANGIFQCGTSVGALVAAPLIIWLTSFYSWRIAFVAMGVLGLLWVALWLGFVSFNSQLTFDDVAPDTARDTSPASLVAILRSRPLWGLLVATCFLNPLQYFYITWLPRYFDKYAGVGFGAALAQRLVLVYCAMDLGLLVGGAVVALFTHGPDNATVRLRVAGFGAACMVGLPLVTQLTNLNVITAILCLATFGHGCFMVNYLACTSEVSARKTSMAAGILGGAGSLAGAGFMLIVGELVEAQRNFGAVFLLIGLMPVAALVGLWFSMRPGRIA